ncbi:GIP [Symbiodinium sp. CCMP2592]|nr:GIP [Symbiodinium sp. CCMP2592]
MAATSFYGDGVWHNDVSGAATNTGGEPAAATEHQDDDDDWQKDDQSRGWQDWDADDQDGEWVWRPSGRDARWHDAARWSRNDSWGRRGSWGGSWTSTSAGTRDHERGDSRRDQGRDADDHPSHGSEDGSDQRPPQPLDQGTAGGRGPSEKLIVPGFSGEGDGDDLGSSARSYLRQVLAWQRMTKLAKEQQALVLYQHLSGPAWVEAERLEVDRLASPSGMEYFTQWVKDRYLDVQVTQVGRSLSEFFRRLKKKPSQSIRDYCGEFDRAYARLLECGCRLPDIACAWVFVDRMGLDEASELNLLASVGNVYDLKMLQRAAIVQDRALRKPWETNPAARGNKGGWWKRNLNTANVADYENEDEGNETAADEDDAVPEDVAEELYETYMTHESAKQKYRESSRMRGSDPEAIKKVAAEKLRLVKARSFCAGCKRRGHWHKDPECPLNQGRTREGTGGTGSPTKPAPGSGQGYAATKNNGPRDNFPCHVVHVTWDIEQDKGSSFQAITDTACSKTVAGAPWMDAYFVAAKKAGFEPEILNARDAFRFGASKVFESAYAVVVSFGLGNALVKIRVCVVNGDVPLLLSRTVLGELGMILDVANNQADFRSVGVEGLKLDVTETGHPALTVRPEQFCGKASTQPEWKAAEIQIISRRPQYTVFAAECMSSDPSPAQERVDVEVQSAAAYGSPCIPAILYLCAVKMAPKRTLLTAPMVTRPKGLWEFTKDELLTEAQARGLWVNPRWTVPQIRDMIKDDLENEATTSSATSGELPPGVSKMTLAQLITMAEDLNVKVPPGTTKGGVLRLIRDQAGGGQQLVMTFGRHRGCLFTETPLSYRRWAISEAASSKTASEDLVAYASWCKKNLEKSTQPRRYVAEDDPELNATTPYVPEDSEALSWVLMPKDNTTDTRPTTTPKAKAGGGYRRPLPTSSASSEFGSRPEMQTEMDAEVMDEIQHLETRLAVIRDRHGLARAFGTILSMIHNEKDEAICYEIYYEEVLMFHRMETKAIYHVIYYKEVLMFDHMETEAFHYVTYYKEVLVFHRMETKAIYHVIYYKEGLMFDHMETEAIYHVIYYKEVLMFDHMETEAIYHVIYYEEVPLFYHRMETKAIYRAIYYKEVLMRYRKETEAIYHEETEAIYHVIHYKEVSMSNRMEVGRKLKHKAFNDEDLLEVVTTLDLRQRQRHRQIYGGKEVKVEGVLGGLWTHGAMSGLSKFSEELPSFVSYVNAYVRERTGDDYGWCSFALNKNVATEVHCDHHNLNGVLNVTMSFGDFSGGELWIHDEDVRPEECVERRDPTGKVLRGRIVDTRWRPYFFDSKVKHATQPWSGDRWCLTCFTTRGFKEATTQQCDQLRALRFPLRKLQRLRAVLEKNRPKKSSRRKLWQNVKRMAALATWSSMATASYLLPEYPSGRGKDSVALLEIGGDSKTLELGELNFFTAEPLIDEDLNDPAVWNDVYETIVELKPGTVWIHSCHVSDHIPSVFELLSEQIAQGRQVVFQSRTGATEMLESSVFKSALKELEDVKHETKGDSYYVKINCGHTLLPPVEEEWGPRTLQTYLCRREETKKEAVNDTVFAVDEPIGSPEPKHNGSSAISFAPGPTIKPEVRSSLKRLHQNLGHIGYEDLGRHLRLAGAGPEVVAAAKRLRCEVCARNKRGQSARPSAAPTLLDFNQVVGVDAFSAYDAWGKRHEFMMMIDYGTSFQVVVPLRGHSTEAMEQDFCEGWSHVFGPPGTIAVDLETGLQAGLARYSEFYGVKMRSAAGQAHWQQGTVERHIRVWKEIWDRIVDDHSVGSDDIHLATTAVNSAMNELRRKNGFSPSQAVWGKDPEVPGELLSGRDPEQFEHIITHDRQRAKEHALRTAAKETYFRCQADAKLRRALLQRSRVSGPDLEVGDLVYFYRKAKNQKFWRWLGPATVIGHEGSNIWLSRGGRCHLTAPEHIRRATSEEIGETFTLKSTQEDLEKLLEVNPDDVLFEGDDVEEDPVLFPGDDGDAIEVDEGGRVRDSQHLPLFGPVAKRYRMKGPQDPDGRVPPQALPDHDPDLDDILEEMSLPDGQPDEVMMLKRAKTARGREKQLEKELPWNLIPQEQHEAFKGAEQKQYMEHIEHEALEPLSVEESLRIMDEKRDRVLQSRFAYRDKSYAKRRKDPDVPWRHKARLVIGGHMDPDIAHGLQTTAPTVSRQSVMLLMQILASRLADGWKAYAGDITAAFLNGGPLERELYLKQPRTGLGNLHPAQLLRIKKGIFGLVDSPHSWWERFKGDVTTLKPVLEDGTECVIEQCPLDPCVFFVKKVIEGSLSEPIAYIAVHVDDVLLVGGPGVCQSVKDLLSKAFPIDGWETDAFEYIGSFIEFDDKVVKVSQESYVESRLFQVDVQASQRDEELATDEQLADNRSLIGALSWLAGQSRPDLQASVSMCQQLQKCPTVGDVRFTNLVARRAYEHKKEGVYFHPIDLDKAVLLCYHDAGWANAPQDEDDPVYQLTKEENEDGVFKEGPFLNKPRKTKRNNSRIASQLGCIYVLANEEILQGQKSYLSVLDWKSGACERVCRSTFAAETMACCMAVEGGDYLEKFLETLLRGSLQRKTTGNIKLRFLSDCRSLYDHLTREGIPRIPCDRRLAIDLAAVRQDIKPLGRLAWVPTTRQLADVLTKPMKGHDWWSMITSPFDLTFREEEVSNQCKSVSLC